MSAPLPDEQYFAFVRCRGDSVPGQQVCGIVGLTMEQYEQQMNKPDSLWYCPNCGSTATYDDARSEKAQGLVDGGGHDPDLDENGICRVCGQYEPE